MKSLIFILCITFISISCSSARTDYPLSDHYDGNIFYNQDKTIAAKGFKDLLKWWLFTTKEKWPDQIYPPYPVVKPEAKVEHGMTLTFVNHATYLIQHKGLNILTDPVWAKRASPLAFAGPKRVHDPGVRFEDLPSIDFVFISHNHYDHMDSETIEKLAEKFNPLFIVPLANKEKIKSFGAKKIVELDWWQDYKLSDEFTLILTPAQHWSSRTPFDRFKSFWGGAYFKSESLSLFFAGDTGYSTHFTEIKNRLGIPQIAILPIGSYEPRWFMKDMHMNPEDAVLAHLDLEAKESIGMHFGTFQLTNEGIEVPMQDLELARLKHKVQNFGILRPGQQKKLP